MEEMPYSNVAINCLAMPAESHIEKDLSEFSVVIETIILSALL